MSRDSGSEQPTQRTVAELLAEYGNSGDEGGDDEQRGQSGRRRRRTEDPTETAPQAIIDRVLSDSGKLRPIDPEDAAPVRTGHRAEPEPAADAQQPPGPTANADGADEQSLDDESSAQEAVPRSAESTERAAETPREQPSEQRKSEQPGKCDQSGKSGKGNYWARRFSVGRKSQARQQGERASRSGDQEQSDASGEPAQSAGQRGGPAMPSGHDEQPSAVAQPGRGNAAPMSSPQSAQPPPAGQYPQQAGQVDPEATVRQTPLPAGPVAGNGQPAAQQSAPWQQPPAPAQQPPAARGAQVAPHPGRPGASGDAQPRVVEGATEQLPAVQPPQQASGGAGGTAMLPAAEVNAPLTARADAPAYPEQAAYLGQAGPEGDYPGSYDDYDEYDDYPGYGAYSSDVYDEEYDDYAEYDSEYDAAVPAGMAAADQDDEDEQDDDEKPSSGRREWFVFAGSTVLGLLAGGVVWFAFRWLWTTFAPAALVAALVITGCLVFVARKYLRLDDLQSVLLAVLVGLVCTVSPAALLLINM